MFRNNCHLILEIGLELKLKYKYKNNFLNLLYIYIYKYIKRKKILNYFFVFSIINNLKQRRFVDDNVNDVASLFPASP